MSTNAQSVAFERPLADCLARFRDREFLFVQPTGNWGDTLIYLGADALIRRVGLRGRTLTVDEFVARTPERDKAVYIHGGGGFNRWCSGKALQALAHALEHHRGPVINGPMTVDDDDGYVDTVVLPVLRRAAAREVAIYVREKTSLGTLMGRLPDGMALCLDHDTSLHLTAAEALEGRSSAERYALFALREDDEAPAAPGGGRVDGVRLDPAMYARSFDHWVRLHALARSIVTNRTHSSIIGAVLGKPTTLLGGSYHKNRSMWEYSLRPRGVQWRDWAVGPQGEQQPAWLRDMPLVGRVAGSWKVQRARKWLRGVPWS